MSFYSLWSAVKAVLKETGEEIQSTIQDVQKSISQTNEKDDLSSVLIKLFETNVDTSTASVTDSETTKDQNKLHQPNNQPNNQSNNQSYETNSSKNAHRILSVQNLESQEDLNFRKIKMIKLDPIKIELPIPDWRKHAILDEIPTFMPYINLYRSKDLISKRQVSIFTVNDESRIENLDDSNGVNDSSGVKSKDQELKDLVGIQDYQHIVHLSNSNKENLNASVENSPFVYISEFHKMSDIQWEVAEKILSLSQQLATMRLEYVPTLTFVNDESFFATYFTIVQRCLKSNENQWKEEYIAVYQDKKEKHEFKLKEIQEKLKKEQENDEELEEIYGSVPESTTTGTTINDSSSPTTTTPITTTTTSTNGANIPKTTVSGSNDSSSPTRSIIGTSPSKDSITNHLANSIVRGFTQKSTNIEKKKTDINTDILKIKDEVQFFFSQLQSWKKGNHTNFEQAHSLAKSATENLALLQNLLESCVEKNNQSEIIKIQTVLTQVKEALALYEGLKSNEELENGASNEDRAMPWDE